ncbi:sugar transferase [Nocardioides ultimimeridianus]
MSAAFEAPALADVAADQRTELWLAPVVDVRREPRLRRAVEWSVTFALVAVLAPLMLTIAVVVAVTSEGPVLFRQQRVGLGGTTFELLKFRTMLVDAERRKAEVFALVNEASGPLTKLRRDPRVTGPGRVLRRFSLDELPQLFNVLGGSMSLVGPRPALPEEVAQFAADEHRRHAVRPGMTGLAQVSGRSDLAWADAVRLDLRYVDHRSPALDLHILLRTVPAVLGARGAY